MKKLIKLISVLLVLTLVFGMFIVGCKKDEKAGGETTTQTTSGDDTKAPAPKENVELTFTQFTAGSDTLPALEASVEAFMKQYPHIKVTPETVGYGEFFQQVTTRIAGGNPPDIFELNFENFYTFASKGSLYEVTPLFAETGFDTSLIFDKALKAFNYNGKQYGVPPAFNAVILVYNKDLFDRANVPYPTKDWTWQDEIEAGKKIRALGKDIFGSFQPIQIHEFYKVIAQNGGSFLTPDKKAYNLNSPENVEALQFLIDKIRVTNINPTSEQLAGTGDWDLFIDGRLGMMKTGPWCFKRFGEDCKFPWDVQVEPGNKTKAVHFFSDALFMPSNAKHPKEAFEFIKYMCTTKEAAQIRIDGKWNIPAINDQEALKAWLDQRPPENRQAVFDSLEYAITPPELPAWGEVEGILNPLLDAARDGLKTPKQVLDEAQAEISARVPLNK